LLSLVTNVKPSSILSSIVRSDGLVRDAMVLVSMVRLSMSVVSSCRCYENSSSCLKTCKGGLPRSVVVPENLKRLGTVLKRTAVGIVSSLSQFRAERTPEDYPTSAVERSKCVR
jgi:hypothetical protein